jgi:hypothetical protein
MYNATLLEMLMEQIHPERLARAERSRYFKYPPRDESADASNVRLVQIIRAQAHRVRSLPQRATDVLAAFSAMRPAARR